MRPALRREVSPMGRLFSRRKYRDLMLGLALLCAVLALMRWPQESMGRRPGTGWPCAAM